MKKLIKSGNGNTRIILRGKDKISSDENHNERVHMGTNILCPSKTEIVTQWTVLKTAR